ncbi:MAG TPA: DEAD/DEAH box helicase family protein [Rhizomicrobium sp.]|jgi:type III restriction enzyme
MPTPFALKLYQAQTLDALRQYLEKVVVLDDADTAFYQLTKRPYIAPPGLPGLPYVCLRVPTGGGKTLLAAHTVAIAADAFLRTDRPVVLWLVPSQTIRDQTLKSLQDRDNPNRRALADRFGENVRILTIQDALYAKRSEYDGGAVVTVATMQAFRVDDKDGRKVYDTNGELMDHFTGLAPEVLQLLENQDGAVIFSLANVLRLHRPVVIVDEAHNARTELSFATLERLNPSLIVEFTATPLTPEEHDPEHGRYASNVLHHVSAAELKAAEMIKLPVVLRGRPDARDTIADAIGSLDELVHVAREEESTTGEFIRPLMLVQAEPRSKTNLTLHAEELKKLLMEDFRVPEEHIAVATGETRGLEKIDLFARDCPIRFIVTQSALREGWDCSFAYVLCSVAEQAGQRAVEQLIGRVLRLPNAKRKSHEELNRAYVFARTTSFQKAAQTLRDGLISNGFERIEAEALIRPSQDTFEGMESGGAAILFSESLPEGVDPVCYAADIEKVTSGRVVVDIETGKLQARGTLTDYDRNAMRLTAPQWEKAIEALVLKSRGARLVPAEGERLLVRFAVPCLGVRRNGKWQLFDRTQFLDIPWRLDQCGAAPVLASFVPPQRGQDEAHIDVTAAGQVTIFVKQLHEQLSLALSEKGWTRPQLINWLDRRLPNASRRDITRASSVTFIDKVLDALEKQHGLALEALARAKYRIVEALVKGIGELREEWQKAAYQTVLLAQSGLELATSAELELVFEEQTYSYNQPYSGGMIFNKHLFRVIGDLAAQGDEFDCAVHIDRMTETQTWVRNTAKQPYSFWLQLAGGKFYPDFVVLLNDGRYLVVEFKGAQLITADEAKVRDVIGQQWAERSEGKCAFVMVDRTEFSRISQVAAGAGR